MGAVFGPPVLRAGAFLLLLLLLSLLLLVGLGVFTVVIVVDVLLVLLLLLLLVLVLVGFGSWFGFGSFVGVGSGGAAALAAVIAIDILLLVSVSMFVIVACVVNRASEHASIALPPRPHPKCLYYNNISRTHQTPFLAQSRPSTATNSRGQVDGDTCHVIRKMVAIAGCDKCRENNYRYSVWCVLGGRRRLQSLLRQGCLSRASFAVHRSHQVRTF